MNKIDEIIGAWLSALGETEESDTGEYVPPQSDIHGALPGADLWQDEKDSAAQSPHHYTARNCSTSPTEGSYPLYTNTSPTVSLASLADPSLSFYSEASSSASSLQTASTSQPASPSYKQWGDETINRRLHQPGGHLAIADHSAIIADSDLNPTSPSLTGPNPLDNHLDDDTPSMTQTSTFINPLFVEFDPDTIYSTHAGRDDDDDSTGYDYCYNSADTYYNDDEHDEEANLTVGWGGGGDGWGAEQLEETPIPEDGRLKAVRTMIF